MIKKILTELKTHAPFTLFGAFTGIVVMMFFYQLPKETAFNIFYVLHPTHVLLSALVTAAMYKKHECVSPQKKCDILLLLLVGYVGSVGIATISDSLIPYFGEILLGMPNSGIHLGFIEKWYLVNPLAVVGVVAAYFWPQTKFPHAMHVLVSTWASLFHVIMAAGQGINWVSYLVIFIFLFLAVWVPCCLSDIVFPLLFVTKEEKNGQSKNKS